jgi:hypothetical protein
LEPYRELTLAPRCAQCEKCIATATCRTCARDFCERHLEKSGMCRRCGEALARHIAAGPRPLIGLYLGGFFVLLTLSVLFWPPLHWASAAYAVAAPPVLWTVESRRRRRRFLARLRRGELPPAE